MGKKKVGRVSRKQKKRMQLKTTMKYHLFMRLAKNPKLWQHSVNKPLGKQALKTLLVGQQKLYNY